MGRRRAVGLLAVMAVGLVACSRDDGGRDRARAEFTQQLVDTGLEPGQAACIVDKFFEGRTNDELNEFFETEELTNDERAEFAALTKECASVVTG